MLSSLLVLIPASLYLHNRDLRKSTEMTKNQLDVMLHGKGKIDSEPRKLLDRATSWFPEIAISIFTWVVASLVILLWVR